MATKRTYQPKKLHGQKVHGFRKRPSVLLSETDRAGDT